MKASDFAIEETRKLTLIRGALGSQGHRLTDREMELLEKRPDRIGRQNGA